MTWPCACKGGSLCVMGLTKRWCPYFKARRRPDSEMPRTLLDMAREVRDVGVSGWPWWKLSAGEVRELNALVAEMKGERNEAA